MPLSLGQRLGPYEIVSPIGSGGMGDVYEARDTRLQRRVALKTLRSELFTDSQARRRFEREAQALSALSHPNICTVYDVGQDAGIDFIVMEYVEGETLSTMLDRRSLDESKIAAYGQQIAEALAEAHERGVLHRDIKPQNVMITRRDLVKVLDFGLARAIAGEREGEVATLSALSGPATVMGTAPYMSPEQVRGEPIDGRSDGFSLGCLLYEAAAGRTPFQARTPVETVSAILTSEPVPLARVAPATTPEFQRIVRKCLEKNPSRRYQTLSDVAIDLDALRRDSRDTAAQSGSGERPVARRFSRRTTASAVGASLLVLVVAGVVAWRGFTSRESSGVRSMAILPFKPLASSVTENYLGLGIADAVISRLSGAPGLVVRPTSAVRRYAGEGSDALQAGGELKVDAVLDGTWQREGDRLRLTVNLLRTSDAASLWTDRFDFATTDVFALQDRVSEQLASRLRIEADSRHSSAPRAGTRNSQAYEAYLKGKFHVSTRGFAPATRESMTAAIELFERAIALDAAYAEAHAALGFALTHTALFMEDSRALIDRAKQATNRAEALRPGLAQVHLTRAMILWSWYEGWRIVDSIREYRKAEELDPALNDLEVAAGYAHLGFFDEWRRAGERVIARDPTYRDGRLIFVNEHFLLNLPEEGIAAQRRLLNEAPDRRYYLLMRRTAAAAPLVEEHAARNPTSEAALADLALLRALQGRHREARDITRKLAATARRMRYFHHLTYTLARVAALGGDAEESARWLQTTIAWGFPCYPMFSTDSFLDPIRNAPAVQQVLADLKVRWEGYRAELR